jgi:hypothetical protein
MVAADEKRRLLGNTVEKVRVLRQLSLYLQIRAVWGRSQDAACKRCRPFFRAVAG